MKFFITILAIAISAIFQARAAQVLQGASGARAINVLSLNTNLNDGETFTINGQVFELDFNRSNQVAGSNVRIDLSTNGTRATNWIVFTNQVVNRDAITIDGKTYQFDTTLTNTDGHVLIGANAAASVTNLFNAINKSGGTIGTDYATATTKPTNFYASSLTTTSIVLTAEAAGSQGNTLAASRAWATNTGVFALFAAGAGANPATDAFLSTNIVRVFNRSNTLQMASKVMATNQILFFTLYTGNPSNLCSEAIAGATFAATSTFGGVSGDPIPTPTTLSRVPTADEVTLGQMQFVFPFTPKIAHVSILTTSTGIAIAWNGARTISGNVLTLDNSGSTDWATTSTVTVLVAP